jgi:hypothetical protein
MHLPSLAGELSAFHDPRRARARMPRGKPKPESPKPEALREGHSKVVLVDGANVAFSSEGEQGVLKNIVTIRDRLVAEGFNPIVVADAALRHKIDDEVGYERLVDEGVIKQAPAGTDADYFILSFAEELDASIVSNDRFKDRIKQYPALRKRLIKYMIVQGEVVFEKRTGRRE